MTAVEAHPLPRSALLFMAMVDEARATNEGPFRAIGPIFRIALEAQRGEVLNLERAASVLGPIFGPNFTQHAIEAFLPQLESLGWIVRVPVAHNQAAYRVPATLPALDEQQAVEGSSAKLERLYDAFQQFLAATAPLFKLSLTLQEFQWELFKWATSLDGADKEAVKAQAMRIAEGETPSAKNAYLDDPQRFSRVDKGLSIEFAGFIKWLAKNGRPEVGDVASLTELGLALEFLEEVRSPSVRDRAEIDTVFVLDAPVLLDLLGLSGPARKDSIATSVDALKARGGKVATLPHCLIELSDILTSILAKPEALRYGLTGDALRSNPALAALARQVAQQPDKACKTAGIELLHFDPKSPLNAASFPEALVDKFRNSATWHDQMKLEQRERDALSIAFVMRRRNGRNSSDVLDTPFVLVARNATFTSFAEQFVRRNLGVPDYAFGPAIETKTLAAFVWMRLGAEAAPALPQLHLIAACDRILASNGELLRKADKRLKDLKGDDAAAALLGSQQAVLDLVIATGGSPDVLDASNGDELLRAMTASAVEQGRLEERKTAEQEKSRLRDEIAERDRNANLTAEQLAALSVENFKKDARLAESDEAIRQRDAADAARAVLVADKIAASAYRQAWQIVISLMVISGSVGLIGQFFVWQGPSWWLQSAANMAWGTLVVLASAIFLAFGLRIISPGELDLGAHLQSKFARRLLLARLSNVDPLDERDRVRAVLRDRQLIGTRRTQIKKV